MSDSKPRPGSVFAFLPEEFVVTGAGLTDSRELWPFQRAFTCQLIVTGPTTVLSGSFDVQGSVTAATTTTIFSGSRIVARRLDGV